MAAPFYFFAGRSKNDLLDPGTHRFRPAPLASAGLDETWRDVIAPEEQGSLIDYTGKGPGGKSGVLVTIFPPSGQAPKRLGYYPEFQRWTRLQDDLWIGLDNEEPPRPQDLLRATRKRDAAGRPAPLHAGYSPTLADGEAWTIPVVRRPPLLLESGWEESDLPHDIGWDESGRFAQTLKIEYQAIWEEAGQLCGQFFGPDGDLAEETTLTVEDGLRRAIRLLQLNYRYGRHEQNVLHAIDRSNVFFILGIALDLPTVKELLDARQKKSDPPAPQASSIALGSPAEAQTIAQAGENSS